MDSVASRAAEVLARHPAPALRLSTLLEIMSGEEPRIRLDEAALARHLERYPETFRFLDPWRGPWCHTRGRIPAELGSGEPWVVVVADPGAGDQVGRTDLTKLRASVRWLAGTADPRSCREVGRAHGMVLGEREARNALRRAA